MVTDTLGWVFAFALGVACWIWLRRKFDRRLRQARARRASRGEKKAEALLRAHGWRIKERQSRQQCSLQAGSQIVRFELIVDLVVEKDGKVMVAEVKTGAGATIAHSGTRRQLLEYLLAFDVDGVLLVDPSQRSITPIEFHLQLDSQHAA